MFGTLNAFLAASGSFFKSNLRVSVLTIAALFGVPRILFVSWVSDILTCGPHPIIEYEAAIVTTETLELLLKKLPEAARKAFRVPDTPHNLIAACELVDAGCAVHLYKHSAEIEFEGETLYQGWRDKPSRLWIFSLTSKIEK